LVWKYPLFPVHTHSDVVNSSGSFAPTPEFHFSPPLLLLIISCAFPRPSRAFLCAFYVCICMKRNAQPPEKCGGA